ncbi:MAG: DUF2071 domain-containing protein [Ardenticatenales bacterium]|nr:DUF2071 domain-containing protein [Ardenticatenales bacterium]
MTGRDFDRGARPPAEVGDSGDIGGAATASARGHRPWPVPARPWAMAMTWHDLLFLHWPVPPAALEGFIPPPLRLDTFDGRAWLGVVPFRMSGIRLRGLPPIPGTAAFPEINVRTYAVAPDGRTGVWFFSLDATSPLAVRAARAWFGLPYFDARIEADSIDGDAVRYAGTRTHRGAPPATFAGRYGPTGPVALAAHGTLEHWLTERYALFSVDRRGRVGCGEIDHVPWPLQPAAADVALNTMAEPIGIALPEPAPLAHFARRLDVVAWTVRSVEHGPAAPARS